MVPGRSSMTSPWKLVPGFSRTWSSTWPARRCTCSPLTRWEWDRLIDRLSLLIDSSIRPSHRFPLALNVANLLGCGLFVMMLVFAVDPVEAIWHLSVFLLAYPIRSNIFYVVVPNVYNVWGKYTFLTLSKILLSVGKTHFQHSSFFVQLLRIGLTVFVAMWIFPWFVRILLFEDFSDCLRQTMQCE